MGGKRVALVTGGAVRIGAAVAEALAQAGWAVVVHARRPGAGAWCVGGDLSVPEGAAEVFAAAVNVAGRVDAVVNNAAVFSTRAAMTDAEYTAMLQVNALAPMALTRCLWAHLRARGACGCAVQMLDQRIAGAGGADTPYVRSKKMLAAFTREAAVEMAPELRVNAVAPGAVLLPAAADERELAGPFLLGARPTPAQVAEAVRWLLEAEAVTGQTLFVDGGQHLEGAGSRA